ncbi:hypothetical protein AP071_00205 [Rhodobacter capsulatus]|nr:hypothetical protein AP073_00200 [Rhodobacter capsulatus]KQB17501.1 hypothetical protein AP071_00205 [Rhodobacter capsulatus]
MAQVMPFEIAARELRAPASVIRQASGANGRIAFSDAVAAAVTFYRAKISDDAFERALRPTRPGPRPGQYGPPPERLRLRRDAACAAQHLATEIEAQTHRLSAVARAQAPEGPADARRVARLGQDLEGLAAALAKRNSRALRGLGPKEIKG